MNITFLVGNGFNHFIYTYFESEKKMVLEAMKKSKRNSFSQQELEEKYDEIMRLLKEYITLLDFLKMDSIEYNGEELLDKLENLLDETYPNFIELIQTKITENIENIMSSFGDSEQLYKMIRNTFYISIDGEIEHDFIYSLKKHLKIQKELDIDQSTEINIITTNYDGIVEQVLKPWSLVTDVRKEINYQVFPIHGTVEDGKELIICNSPKRKKSSIYANSILANRFDQFGEVLKTSNLFIIFGNSLYSDPHIIEMIDNYLCHDAEIVIIDPKPEVYLARLAKASFIQNNKMLHRIPVGSFIHQSDGTSEYIGNTPQAIHQRLTDILTRKEIIK